MSYYLKSESSGGNFVELSVLPITVGSNIGDYVEWSGFASGDSTYPLVGISTSFDSLINVRSGDIRFRPNDRSNNDFSSNYTQPAYNQDFVVRIERVATNTWECYLNGQSLGQSTDSRNFSFDQILKFSSNGTPLEGGVYYFEISTSGGAATNRWDADASGGTGSTLPDTIGGNDGTLNNFPTDDSQWVFYSDPAPSETAELSGNVALPAMTSTGIADATLPQPSITGSSQLAAITSTGQASVTLPQPSISASVSFSPVGAVGAASATLPQPTITGAISLPAASANGSTLATLPDPSLSGSVTFSGVTASGGATATLPGFNASGVITLPSMLATGQAEVTLPQASFGAAVTLSGLQASGVATATEPGFNVSGNALLPTISATGLATATLPQGAFSGNITLPSIQASGYIVGGQVIIQIEPDANIQAPSMSSSITAPRLSTNVTR